MQGVLVNPVTPEQLDRSLLPKRFLALFPQRFGSVFRAVTSKTWRVMSQFHYLEDEAIMASLANSAKNIRACLSDKRARYIVLSIAERDDGTHIGIAKGTIERLHSAGLKPNIYRESGSSSIQIFLAFSGLVDVAQAAEAVARFMQLEHLTVLTETPFVLPLQQGFAWLNQDLSVKVECDQIALEAAMAMFLHDIELNAMPADFLETLNQRHELTDETVEISSFDELEPQEILERDADESQLGAIETIEDVVPVQDSGAEPEVLPPIEVPPAEPRDTITEVPVSGGQQLLLFPVQPQLVQLELPKERPKRGRRPRSNLPDAAQTEPSALTLFTISSRDAQGAQSFSKEVSDD